MSNRIYISIHGNVYSIRRGVAKRYNLSTSAKRKLRAKSYIIYAVPIKRRVLVGNLKIALERDDYLYYYILDSGQRVLISAEQMNNVFNNGVFAKEHCTLSNKNIFIMEGKIC